MLPCICFLGKWKRTAENGAKEEKAAGAGGRDLLTGGIACGILLFGASSLQQVGIQYTTAGKAGFITACYIVIVPVLGIFLKKKIGWKVWAAVVLAVVGLYFLCITESLRIGKGDFAGLSLCAGFFSAYSGD